MNALPLGLTDSVVQSFRERGFAVARGVFSAGEVDRLRDAFDRLAEVASSLDVGDSHRGEARFVIGRRPDGGRAIARVVWCGGYDLALEAAGRDPRLLRLASCVLGTRALVHLLNQAHFKQPGDGVAFAWHQDSRHRRYGTPMWRDATGTGGFVQTVLALDEATATNGALRFLAGSHRRGHRGADLGSELPADLAEIEPETAEMGTGDVALFGPFVVHGSDPNRSSRPRRVLINGYAVPGVNRRVYPGAGVGRPLYAPDPTAAGV